MPPENTKKLLQQILNQSPAGHLVVFDLDSTLYNVSHRTHHILRHFIEHPENRSKFKEIDHLLKVDILHTDWGLKQSLERVGFHGPAEMYSQLRKHWKKFFFSNEFLHHDQPYPGAVDYVNALADRGHSIIYLTGRDKRNMLEGTIASLSEHRFPLPSENHLIMKAFKGAVEDEDFKVLELKKIVSQYETITFFENEPVILNNVQAKLPEVRLIWVDTTHSGREEPPKQIPSIKGHYLID